MASTYLNTGVLGQVVGGTLSTGSLGGVFRDFKTGVQSKKRTISGISQQEREAQRKRREERLKSAEETTGVAVDTADVKVPAIPVEPTAPPEVQQKQEQDNITAAALGITKVEEVAKPAPAPAPAKVAPEKTYGESDIAFIQAFDALYQNINTKNASAVQSNAQLLRDQYTAAHKAAQASGRAEYMQAIGSVEGVGWWEKNISAQNIGRAKATSLTSMKGLRDVVDVDEILRKYKTSAAPAGNVTTTALNKTTKVSSSRFGGMSSRDYYRSLNT